MLTQIRDGASQGLFSCFRPSGKEVRSKMRRVFVIVIIIALLLVLAAPLG